jgi:5-formyltetrahydrofolate cyclo-ligase
MIRLLRPFRAPIKWFMEVSTKVSLRAEARRILSAIPADTRIAASTEICRRIAALPQWASARTVALYAAQPSEPDLAPLLRAPGKKTCFPRTAGSILDFHFCHSGELLRPGPWNLLEPDPVHCPVVPVSEIDLLLIPGLAFTRAGGRLGRGGGYYDRFLSRIHPRAVKIGICFHAQLVPELPLEIHDHAVDHLITESETIPCS